MTSPTVALTLALLSTVPSGFGPEVDGQGHVYAALEAGPLSFPSGTRGGGQDFFAQIAPRLTFLSGDDFALSLGAPLRFRLVDAAPAQKSLDYGGTLRREDWDSRSDYAQVIDQLRIGSANTPVSVLAGALDDVTLGLGHLVSHYDNRMDPNYHPMGAMLVANAPTVRLEALASDLLAARLFAADVRLDLGRVFGGGQSVQDRFFLSVSGLQDFSKEELETSTLTAMQVEGEAVLYAEDAQQVGLYAGVGTRFQSERDNPPVGAVAGVSAEGMLPQVKFRGKVEARRQGDGFRQGIIGPSYEVARFSDTGLTQPGIATAQLPIGYSVYFEGGLDVLRNEDGVAWLTARADGEHYNFGRTDLDGALTFRTADQKAAGTFRVSMVGLGEDTRYHLEGELRCRLGPSLYALASGGTVFFPQADDTLARGAFASVGIGADLWK